MPFQRGDLRIPNGSVHTNQQYRLVVDGSLMKSVQLVDQQFPNSVFVWESPKLPCIYGLGVSSTALLFLVSMILRS